MQRKNYLIAGLTAVLLVLVTAGASAFITQRALDDKQEKAVSVSSNTHTQKETIHWNDPPPAPVKQASRCNDGNIAGMIVGGVGGGVLGNQVGSGKGNTAATIGGTLGGAYLGKEYIPLDNVTCQ